MKTWINIFRLMFDIWALIFIDWNKLLINKLSIQIIYSHFINWFVFNYFFITRKFSNNILCYGVDNLADGPMFRYSVNKWMI